MLLNQHLVTVIGFIQVLRLSSWMLRSTVKQNGNYAILFMSELEEKILNSSLFRSMVWWRYIDDVSSFLGRKPFP